MTIRPLCGYPALEAAIFLLLFVNSGAYMLRGTLSEAIDSSAWLALLILFKLETGSRLRLRGKAAAHAMRAGRLVAAVAIAVAGYRYVMEREWLDAANVSLWIAVVLLLELEVRCPRAIERGRIWFTSTALLLYTGLASLVLMWAWRGEWFNAYDASLWLAAFATIEMDVLRNSRA